MSQLPLFKNNEVYSNPVRLMVKESHAIFATIPRNGDEVSISTAITISRRYRSIVHECVENLTRDITCDHSDQITTFKELEVIWNLCEILFLDVAQRGTLILQLTHWIKMHFDELCQEAKDMLRLLEAGNYRFDEHEVEEIYWDLLTKLVLRGETKKAIQLLSSHHEFHRDDQMQLVAGMLDNMPLSNQYIEHEFCNKWSEWSAWCKSQRGTGQFDNNPSLLNIVRLLSQDSTVYEQLASQCHSWYSLMVAHLLYSDPCIRETDLPELCRRMIGIFRKNNMEQAGQSSEPNPFDKIIIAAFDYDLISVIANCCSYLDDNWWFVTHYVDLLHCCFQLSIHEIAESDKLRETFLQDYATTLFDDELLWPIGVSYLDSCPKNGLSYLEILLSRIPLSIDDEMKAHKIISIAKKRGLNGIVRDTSILMARCWLSKTTRLTDESIKPDKSKRVNDKKLPPGVNLSNALYWAVKSGDAALISYISDQYLYYYCKAETFPDKSVFESLKRSPLENERLAFLTKYFEFKEMVQDSEDDLTEAGSLLRALLASKIYPKFFCPVLLNDAKRLLEVRPQLVFRPERTLDLMKSIEEITKDGMMEEDIHLRKNLVRNMARALITPVHLSGDDK